MAHTNDAHAYLDHAGLVKLIELIRNADATVAGDANRALNALVGEIPAKVGETSTATVVAYVNAKVAASASEDDARLDALEATHATKENGSFQTVAEEVATGIANLRDGADEAFDTLKEIAEWIQSSEGNAEGFDAAKRIIALEDAVDADSLVVAEGKDKTVQNAIDKAVAGITTTIGNMDADFTGTKAVSDEDGFVTVGLKEEDGVITTLTVATSDIASAALLGTAEDTSSAATAFGAIKAEEEARKAQIGTIPEKVGETVTANVVAYVDAKVAAAENAAETAIEGLDSFATATDSKGLVTVAVRLVDGMLEGSDGEDETLKTAGVTVSCAIEECNADDVAALWADTTGVDANA